MSPWPHQNVTWLWQWMQRPGNHIIHVPDSFPGPFIGKPIIMPNIGEPGPVTIWDLHGRYIRLFFIQSLGIHLSRMIFYL